MHHLAVAFAVIILFSTAAADVFQPLHVAALRGNCEAIKVLLDAGLNPTTKSHRGWTPLHEALAARAMPAAKLLHRKIEDNTAAKIRARREQLLETMKEMPDYSLQVGRSTWVCSSWT